MCCPLGHSRPGPRRERTWPGGTASVFSRPSRSLLWGQAPHSSLLAPDFAVKHRLWTECLRNTRGPREAGRGRLTGRDHHREGGGAGLSVSEVLGPAQDPVW